MSPLLQTLFRLAHRPALGMALRLLPAALLLLSAARVGAAQPVLPPVETTSTPVISPTPAPTPAPAPTSAEAEAEAEAEGEVGPASDPATAPAEVAAGEMPAAAEPEPPGEAADATPPAEPAAGDPPLPEVQPLEWKPGEDCDLAGKPQDGLERSQRLLLETFCEATLWLDGLFGGEADLDNARNVAGRVEVSALHTEMWGTEYDVRLRLNYDLPTLERRLKLYLGRGPREDVVQGRVESLAVRSSVFGVEDENRWLAGLGWSPPGRFREKVDFRVGGDVSSSPEVFFQGRYRHNVFLGDDTAIRLREVAFWENDEGFGSTTSVDLDHVLRHDTLVRLAGVGTWSEATSGVDWYSNAVLYRNLRNSRAAAAQLFASGDTGGPVELREYGARLIYRQPLRRQGLFAEVVTGYSWPREYLGQDREGSAMVGLGIELLFGRDPY
jgi:hypothetical protein